MSKQALQSCFLANLLDELTALSKDLPPGGPAVASTDAEVLGVVIDDLTKAAYFLLTRIQGDEAKTLRLAELALEMQQVETGKSFEVEAAELRVRRYAHTLRKQTVETLLWTGMKGQVASLVAHLDGTVTLGPGWEIILLPNAEDGGMGGMPVFIAAPSSGRRRRRQE